MSLVLFRLQLLESGPRKPPPRSLRTGVFDDFANAVTENTPSKAPARLRSLHEIFSCSPHHSHENSSSWRRLKQARAGGPFQSHHAPRPLARGCTARFRGFFETSSATHLPSRFPPPLLAVAASLIPRTNLPRRLGQRSGRVVAVARAIRMDGLHDIDQAAMAREDATESVALPSRLGRCAWRLRN